MVAEAFLHGDSTQIYAVAVLSMKEDQTMKLAKSLNLNGSFEDVCKTKELRTAVCKELDGYGKKAGLMSFEQAKNIWLETKPFNEIGITTNTFKLQRFQAKKHYAK